MIEVSIDHDSPKYKKAVEKICAVDGLDLLSDDYLGYAVVEDEGTLCFLDFQFIKLEDSEKMALDAGKGFDAVLNHPYWWHRPAFENVAIHWMMSNPDTARDMLFRLDLVQVYMLKQLDNGEVMSIVKRITDVSATRSREL